MGVFRAHLINSIEVSVQDIPVAEQTKEVSRDYPNRDGWYRRVEWEARPSHVHLALSEGSKNKGIMSRIKISLGESGNVQWLEFDQIVGKSRLLRPSYVVGENEHHEGLPEEISFLGLRKMVLTLRKATNVIGGEKTGQDTQLNVS